MEEKKEYYNYWGSNPSRPSYHSKTVKSVNEDIFFDCLTSYLKLEPTDTPNKYYKNFRSRKTTISVFAKRCGLSYPTMRARLYLMFEDGGKMPSEYLHSKNGGKPHNVIKSTERDAEGYPGYRVKRRDGNIYFIRCDSYINCLQVLLDRGVNLPWLRNLM